MQQHPITYFDRITTTFLVVVMLLLTSCRKKNEILVSFAFQPDSVPTLITDTVSTLISDSGITRYKLVTDIWMVFDKAQRPYWFFPKGIYLERFTPDFKIEATVRADSAWYFTDTQLWQLKKHVHVENMIGEQFDSPELFWDRKEQRVYSDKYIEIKSKDTKLKGYGFESNQSMTDYRIFRPHDAIIPITEKTPSDSLSTDSQNSDLSKPMPTPSDSSGRKKAPVRVPPPDIQPPSREKP